MHIYRKYLKTRSKYGALMVNVPLHIKKQGVQITRPRENLSKLILLSCETFDFKFPWSMNYYIGAGAHQMEPPSPLISWVNPFPSRFINRTACFPRKVSYFRKSRMSRWKNKIGWSRTQKPVLRPFSFFTLRPFLIFTAAGIWVSWNKS